MDQKTKNTRFAWDSLLTTDVGIMGMLFLAALMIRLPRLGALDFWFDEVALLFQTKMSFAQILSFSRNENFPPLYGWLLKVWTYFGSGDYWFRLSSALTGAMIPPLIYIFGKEAHSKKLGLIISSMMLISLPLIFYSQIVRMYSLWMVVTILSYFWLFKALRTNQWKYWILMAAANLVAYYTFLMTLIFLAGEFCVIVWYYRTDWSKYRRVFLAHLPAFLLMGLWVVIILQRYQTVAGYVTWHFGRSALLDTFTYFGTGRAFRYDSVPSVLFNLPMLAGLLLGIPKWRQFPFVMMAGFMFFFGGITIAIASTVGHSMFIARYMLFLHPLYFLLVVFGWYGLRKKWARYAGLGSVFIALIVAMVVFQTNYIYCNDIFRYEGQFESAPSEDGHSLSRIAKHIEKRLLPNEVIIHYTLAHVRKRCFSYFTSIYYHDRSLPEYIISKDPIPIFCGGQYLKPGEWIRTLDDFKSPPPGIWVITWNTPGIMDYTSLESANFRFTKPFWSEDFPLDLYNYGYRARESMTDQTVSAVHFILESDSNLVHNP